MASLLPDRQPRKLHFLRRGNKLFLAWQIAWRALVLALLASTSWTMLCPRSPVGAPPVADEALWQHNLTAARPGRSCGANVLPFDGECIARAEIGRVRYDPCNPAGQRVVREPWRAWHGRAGSLSGTLGTLERHRFDCIVVPRLVEAIVARRIARHGAVDLGRVGAGQLDHFAAPFLHPVRVIVFGPHGELGKMRAVAEVMLRAGKYPLDYVQADWDPKICAEFNALRINAMQMPFPDGFFSAVFFSHILEHVPDMNVTLAEIARVLEPGGFALLSSPMNPFLQKGYSYPGCNTEECRLKRYGQIDHVRNIGMDLLDLVSTHFDFYKHGLYSSFFTERMPDMRTIFDNPEYHWTQGKAAYTYAFKGDHEEEVSMIFG